MKEDDVIIALTDAYEDKIAEWEENFFAAVELLGEVHTSPVIFEDVNRALRDDAKTLLEKLNQSTESEEK